MTTSIRKKGCSCDERRRPLSWKMQNLSDIIQIRGWLLSMLLLSYLVLLQTALPVESLTEDETTKKPRKAKKHQSKLPHILMIVMDDLGSHDLGIHGTGIYTPNTDQLAKDGLYLDNYYVLPYCSPTRAALLSGKYPLHTGVQQWIPPKSTSGLPLEDPTLADMLSAKYSTHAVGKWHIGHSSWEQTPTFRGFSTFFGFYTGGEEYFTHEANGAYDLRYDTQYYCGEACSQIVDERGNYSTHVFTREAIHAIQDYAASLGETGRQDHGHHEEEDPKKPLFLYLAYQAVHCPNEVPQEYIDPRYTNRTDWTDRRKNYAGMLSAADEGIGNVTRALQDSGLWDDTLVIFTTDNGGPIVDGCAQGSSNYPKRGGKTSVWEGGITGDAFLSGPALSSIVNLPTKERFPHLFHVVDWLPTIAELTGLLPNPNGRPLDGISQLQSLRYGGSSARDEIFLGYAYSDSTKSWYGPAIRYRNWKLLQGPYGGPDQFNGKATGSKLPLPGGATNSTYWLFDLETDLTEETNLVTQYPEMAETLMYKLREYQQSCVPFQPNDDTGCPFTGFVNTTVGPTW